MNAPNSSVDGVDQLDGRQLARGERGPQLDRGLHAQEVKQQRVDALGLLEHASSARRPRCARSATSPCDVARRTRVICASSRKASPVLQIAERVGLDGRERAASRELAARVQARAVPVQRGGQRARAREVARSRGRGRGAMPPTRASAPSRPGAGAPRPPRTGTAACTTDCSPLLDPRARERGGVADGERRRAARRARAPAARAPRPPPAPQSWPTTCAFSTPSVVEHREHVGDADGRSR